MAFQNPKPKIQNRIDSIFAGRRNPTARLAIMPFITGGYPSLDATERTIIALERAGASIIEIGFPFSDPIADGPVIAQSMHEALRKGVTPLQIFESTKRVRAQTAVGLVAMVSDSIVTRIGPERFVAEAAAAGFDGLIVPDIDLEAARPLSGLARLYGLSFTLLVAPTSSAQRIEQIAGLCSGFVYMLARAGVTGETGDFDAAALAERIALIRGQTTLPVAVGFGISRPDQVAAIAGLADAAIIGSALVRRMGQPGDAVEGAASFIQQCVAAAAGQP